MESIVTQQINKIRDEEQRKALNKWARNNYIGSIIAGTGFGKSRCGIMAIDYVFSNHNANNALILVPTVQLQEQFVEEFDKWNVDSNNVEIICYQSAYKLKGNHYNIVICDEIHLGLSNEYRKFFKYNTYDKLLCMTATLPEELEYKDLLEKIAPTVIKLH